MIMKTCRPFATLPHLTIPASSLSPSHPWHKASTSTLPGPGWLICLQPLAAPHFFFFFPRPLHLLLPQLRKPILHRYAWTVSTHPYGLALTLSSGSLHRLAACSRLGQCPELSLYNLWICFRLTAHIPFYSFLSTTLNSKFLRKDPPFIWCNAYKIGAEKEKSSPWLSGTGLHHTVRPWYCHEKINMDSRVPR